MAKQDQANQENVAERAAERFVMPKKAFIQPSKPILPALIVRNTEPAKPLRERSPLPSLNLPTLGRPIVKESKERAKPAASKQGGPAPKVAAVKFSEEHVCSDEQFIIRTRAHSIHDPGMKELFYANGGWDIVDQYRTIAQAFDQLRRVKLGKIAGVVASAEPTRMAKQDIKVFIPGGSYTDAQRIRDAARDEAKRRSENENWIRQPIERKTA